ncbi:MAG TPA: hypothetical protein VGO56_07230 [Pyrinomonadaceae bacterium]|nr:hypothetical protein [Pyrinomonadaceae bacterium]
MSRVEELFDQAYKLSILEEKHREAIDLCRRALEIEPDNYRVLVFLGMLLGDHGNDGESEITEARNCFITAIQKAKSASYFCTTWPEEAAIHHLGVWEWSQEHHLNAAMFFLIDAFLCNNKESSRMLAQLLAENDLPVARDIQFILTRIMSENRLVAKS